MELLLAVAEDSATLRSDMSAVYGVGGESDATDIALFFVTAITAKRRWLRGRNASIASRQSGLRPSLNALHHPTSLSLENLKAENLGSGQCPVSRRLLLVQALALPHGLLTVNEDRVCIMNNAVADRIS